MSSFSDVNNLPAFVAKLQEEKLRWMNEAGKYMQDELRDEIANQKGNWQRLHPITTERKGHSQILIESGKLRDSFSYAIISAQTATGQGEVWVGIIQDPRNASLMNIHEFGANIRVTPRMRSFLHYIGIHLRPSTGIIRIPPRPVLGPVAEREMDSLMKTYVEMIDKLLGEFNVK